MGFVVSRVLAEFPWGSLSLVFLPSFRGVHILSCSCQVSVVFVISRVLASFHGVNRLSCSCRVFVGFIVSRVLVEFLWCSSSLVFLRVHRLVFLSRFHSVRRLSCSCGFLWSSLSLVFLLSFRGVHRLSCSCQVIVGFIVSRVLVEFSWGSSSLVFLSNFHGFVVGKLTFLFIILSFILQG